MGFAKTEAGDHLAREWKDLNKRDLGKQFRAAGDQRSGRAHLFLAAVETAPLAKCLKLLYMLCGRTSAFGLEVCFPECGSLPSIRLYLLVNVFLVKVSWSAS